METKFDSRQGQFPATFPDTFKDFFSMMSEDEDHLDLFTNLLEDKVIPRAAKHNQRRCGGSFRCTTNTNTTTNFGRSNSFRVNRPTSNFCKHTKYCCLHQQQQYSPNIIDFGYDSPSNADNEHLDTSSIVKNTRTSLLDRTFECESCEESDTISTSSSTTTIPYNAIGRQQQNKAFRSKESLLPPRIVQQQCVLRESLSGTIGGGVGGGGAGGGGSSGASNMGGINIRSQKSPVMNRRRSSSITAALMATDNKIFRNSEDPPSWTHGISHSNTRERLCLAKSPVTGSSFKGKPSLAESGVLTLKQAMSGAVSPQYTPTTSSVIMGFIGPGSISPAIATNTTCTTPGMLPTTPGATLGISSLDPLTPTKTSKGENFLSGSVATITQGASKQRQRMRTSSMPAESRKPRLADTRRAAIHCADMDIEYYRLRSFSITSHGICNLGDSMRSRRSRSINSVTSTGTSNSGRDRNNSNASRTSGDIAMDNEPAGDMGANTEGRGKTNNNSSSIPAYKIAILGASGVGKTALTYQFTTSDYICAYDLSLDDDYGQKTVSVLLDGLETDLEIIDHPACEMSTEAFCSTYNIDLFVVVYSVVDRNSFKAAEKVLQYLKDNEMLFTRGAILVGNKTDLERHREVPRQTGRRLAKDIACKFIETSSGLDHNVDELLVGVVAQVKLNPQRIHNLTDREKQRLAITARIQKHRRVDLPARKIVKQKSIGKEFENNLITTSASVPLKKPNKRILNLESILKVSESDIDDEDDDGYRPQQGVRRDLSRIGRVSSRSSSSRSSSPKTRNSYETQQQQQQQRQNSSNFGDDCKESQKSTGSKFSNRTKIFLTSVLKFKKNLNVKRRSSSNCSDLFVI